MFLPSCLEFVAKCPPRVACANVSSIISGLWRISLFHLFLLVFIFSPARTLQFAGVTVDRSFDVWSLGMAILHLYMGRSYFQSRSDPEVSECMGLWTK